MYKSIHETGISYDLIADFTAGTPVGRPEEPLLAYGISTDSRTAKKGDIFIALKGENFDGHRFLAMAEEKGCVFAVVDHITADCTLPLILVEDTTKALGRIAAGYKHLFRTITLAVTGSVGKTTTKEYIYAVLSQKYPTNVTKGNFNNEIGLPLTMFGLTSEHKAQLLEMGMNHKGEIAYLSDLAEPDISVITNIGTSHIEHLGSKAGIRDAKMEIIHGMHPGGVLILNGDDPFLRDVKTDAICKIYVGIHHENLTYRAENIRMYEEHMLFDIHMRDGDIIHDLCINMIGKHHIMNALIACVCGLLLGISEEKIKEGLLAFTPAAMRQHFMEKDGMILIEDCYNASPESMYAGLEVLCHTAKTKSRRAVAVLGDMLELGNVTENAHFDVGKQAAKLGISHLITYGKAAEFIAKGAVSHGMNPNAVTVLSDDTAPEETAQTIRSVLKPGDAVLFKASRAMALERIVSLI